MPEQHADQDPTAEQAETDEAAVRPNRAERRNKGKTENKTNGVSYNPHLKTASTGHQRQYSNRRSGG
jgi:hypothetical protein